MNSLKRDEGKGQLSKLRVAIVHYWFVGRAGGERVVEVLAELFPQADIFTLLADQSVLAPIIKERKVHTSFLQKIPGALKFYRHSLMAQPFALEQFDLSSYDLVISSESGPAKGVITAPHTCHICYCHSPMRYIWDMYNRYVGQMGRLQRPIFSSVAHYMRIWDYVSAGRVDYFVANSHFVSSRIRKTYRRESSVIYPPVNISPAPACQGTGDHYLTVGRLVDYKRVDLAVAACKKLGRELRIVGDGPEYRKLKREAGPTVQFLGSLNEIDLQKEMRDCRALLFPGQEDFGLVPVEVQGFGRPVIALASGGALETVRGIMPGAPELDNPTGVFFTEQTSPSLEEGIVRFEAMESKFVAKDIRQHSLQFAPEHFKSEFARFAQLALEDFKMGSSAISFGGLAEERRGCAEGPMETETEAVSHRSSS